MSRIHQPDMCHSVILYVLTSSWEHDSIKWGMCKQKKIKSNRKKKKKRVVTSRPMLYGPMRWSCIFLKRIIWAYYIEYPTSMSSSSSSSSLCTDLNASIVRLTEHICIHTHIQIAAVSICVLVNYKTPRFFFQNSNTSQASMRYATVHHREDSAAK